MSACIVQLVHCYTLKPVQPLNYFVTENYPSWSFGGTYNDILQTILSLHPLFQLFL